MDELVCPGCSANLSQRELLMNSVVTESCPRCRTVVRQGDAFRYENVQARTTEDVSGVDHWLFVECQQLHQTYEQIRGRESSGEYRWRIVGDLLAGCPDNWILEVVHTTSAPGIVAILITAVEQSLLPDGLLQSFRSVFYDHGLQPHGSRTPSFDIAGSSQETRWGVQQHLSIGPFAQGLLRPVVVRLLGAMRDAMTTRQRQ
jgi:Zn-finger nucleic acid-binding protein